MDVVIESPDVTIDVHTKEHIYNHLFKVIKFLDPKYVSAKVMLERQSPNVYKVSVNMAYKNLKFSGTQIHRDIFEAIREAFRKAQHQIQNKTHTKVERHYEPGETSIDWLPVSSIRTVEAKPMSHEEAMLQLAETDRNLLVYKDEDTFEMRILYKNPRGKYALLIPT